MPIGSIISQPESNGLKAAYRPIVLRVSATKTDNTAQPPVVYCDVYFNDIFYKTISKTQYALLELANSEWQFDIQDAAQEYLKKFLGDNGESAIIEATPIITRCFCRFRSSGLDDNGFITTENTAPVQGTSSADPVSGTGSESNTFFILNATLQHEDAQDLSIHLNSLKKRTWGDTTYPITHRPDNYLMCIEDSDVFPILHEGNDLSCLVFYYQNKGQSTWNHVSNCEVVSCPSPDDSFEIFVLDNGDGTQTFTCNWDTVFPPTAQLDIQTRPANSTDDWTSYIGSVIPTREITLPIGLYDFRIQGIGDCHTKPGSEFEDYGIAICTPVTIQFAPLNIPNGQVGVPYDYTVYLLGTAPFNIASSTKPSWMTMAIVGSTLKLTGTPDDDGLAIPVSFTVSNCSGTQTATASDTINVISATLSTITNNSAETFAYKIKINGVIYGVGSIAPGITNTFSAPELGLGEGYELVVYTTTLLMTTCKVTSNSVDIPMVIDMHGPGTNNIATNLAAFAIVNGIQIEVS